MFRPFQRSPAQRGNRGQDSAYRRNPELCFDCRKVFTGPHQCKIACVYCHDFHLRKELIDNICPLIYPLAKKEQQKNSFQCKICKGEGSYTQEVETIKYEPQKKYQERLKEWSEMLRLQQSGEGEKPARRMLNKQKTTKELECSDCHGKGRIMRMIVCCKQGCRGCNGDKYVVNPVWKKYRKEPVQNEKIFQCPICLMDVEVTSQKYMLNCRHEFHPDCIFRWMRTKKSCPVCRQTDLYMQGVEFKPSLLEERAEIAPSLNYMPFRMRVGSEDDSWDMDLYG